MNSLKVKFILFSIIGTLGLPLVIAVGAYLKNKDVFQDSVFVVVLCAITIVDVCFAIIGNICFFKAQKQVEEKKELDSVTTENDMGSK